MPSDPFPGSGGAAAKLALRDQHLTRRNRRSLADVAAYVSIGNEPGTGHLLDRLEEAGKRVILPVLLPDGDLDWAPYRGEGTLVPARRGLLEPVSERLGPDAVATADVVLVPGLAVGPDGLRLGRGGGSYDRALARVPAGTFTCVLLYDDEVGLDGVPAEPHDRRVVAAASPAGITALGPGTFTG